MYKMPQRIQGSKNEQNRLRSVPLWTLHSCEEMGKQLIILLIIKI